MLQVEGLSKRFGDRVLFEGLTFALERGSKVGLIAPNGSGKTTLMNILVGVEPYESGSITHANGLRWAYLPQLPQLPDTGTILSACFSSYDPIARLVLAWEEALLQGDEATMQRLLPDMEAQGGWSYEQRAKEILGALGLHDYSRSIEGISGGEAKRIALAATLISEPDLLYLDEPTNHLDLRTIEWLEGYLARSTMSLILITHDRYFLDRVCNQIIELDHGQLYRYRGGYDYYLEKRDERHEAETASLGRARNLYRRELEWMRRQPQARGGKARYRIEAFEGLEARIATRRTTSTMQLQTSDVGYIGNKIFEARGLCKCYGDKVILRDFDYTFARRDKIGIVGENGVGKTTFLRLLLGLETPDAGTIEVGQTVRFGYYSQEAPAFDPGKRVIDVVTDIAEHFEAGAGDDKLSASQMLTQFLFPPDRQYTPVGKLSGGELRRLYLCTVLVRRPNFLVLDEPTNDLDILTLNVLEEYLAAFTGCVIIVSHDRFFMDKVTEHLLCFEGGGIVRDFPGSYSLYRAWCEHRASQAPPPSPKPRPTSVPADGRTDRPRAVRLSYAEKKELERIELRLPELEAEQARLEAQLASGTLATEAIIEASSRIGAIIEEMDTLVLRQLELEDKIG